MLKRKKYQYAIILHVEEITSIVGINLKNLRKSRQLTLEGLSSLTGVSVSMLGEIERGLTNPTITILWKIAEGLKIPFSEFLKSEKESITVVRCNDTGANLNLDGFVIQTIFGFDPDKRFEIFMKTIEPGAAYLSNGHRKGIEEYLLVCDGILTLDVGETRTVLSKGDAIRFEGMLPHYYRNLSDKQVSAFAILYYNPG